MTRSRTQYAQVAQGKTKWQLELSTALLDAVEAAADRGGWASRSAFVRRAMYEALPADLQAGLTPAQLD